SAQPGPVHLPAVRVAAQHQVATVAVHTLDRLRVVGEDHARPHRVQAGHRAVRIAAAAPEIVEADQVQLGVAAGDGHRLVPQDAYAVAGERLHDGAVQVTIAGDAESAAN